MRSKSMFLPAEDTPGRPEQSQLTYTAEDAYLTCFGMKTASEGISVRSRSFVEGPGLGGNQAAPLDYSVGVFPHTFLPLEIQGCRYAETVFAGQAFTSSVTYADSSAGGHSTFCKDPTEPYQTSFALGESLHLQAYRQNNFQGTRIQDNNLQAPPMCVCLRGGADSPADDNTEQLMTNVDHTASEPDTDVDSLYRVDLTPRDLNGQFDEILGGRTGANGVASETLGPEHAQNGLPVHGPYTPVNDLHAPVDGLYAPNNSPNAPVDGFDTPTNGFNEPVNDFRTRVPYQVGSSYQNNPYDLAGAHVNRNPPASPSRRGSPPNSAHSRVNSMADAQQEEDDWVIDWWLCEPLGRVPSGASYSSSVDSFIAATYFGPNATRSWRDDYNYNAYAGFEMQERNVGTELFSNQQNGTLSQVPDQQQDPSSNMWSTNPEPPEPHPPQDEPETPTAVPTYSDVHMNNVGTATAQPSNTNGADELRSNTRSRGIFNNARRLGRGVFRNRGIFRRR